MTRHFHQYRRHPIDRQGGPRFPQPRAILLQDRLDGVLYLLSHDANTPIITTSIPPYIQARPEEPLVALGREGRVGLARLFVTGGVLSQEQFAFRRTGDFGPQRGPFAPEPLYTFNPSDRHTTYEIHGRNTLAPGGGLCLRRITGLGRAIAIADLGCNFLVAEEELSVLGYGDFGLGYGTSVVGYA